MKNIFTFILVLAPFINQALTIAEARNLPAGTVVTLSGIVTNGQELGNIRYFQDGTAGIAAYGATVSSILRGDSITVTGTLKQYNNLLELDPVSGFTIHSSGNTLPAALVITPSQIGESYEGQLVKINDAMFLNVPAGSNFSGNTNYNLTSNGQNFVIRVVNTSPLVGKPIPASFCKVTAIISQYSTSNPSSGYQLLPRDQDDIVSLAHVAFTSPVTQTIIETDLIELEWTTDSIATTEIYYGTTPALEMGHLSFGAPSTLHTATIETEPASMVYVRAFSVCSGDTAFSGISVFASRSLSSGAVKVYFNHPVDASVATGNIAQAIPGAFTDTVIAYINRAAATIDVTMYDVDNEEIIIALNEAYARGVAVRYITDGDDPNPVLENLSDGIPLLGGNYDAIMHDKFIIIDVADQAHCQVITGSTNHTNANLNLDYNSMIIIQDQSLAKAYVLEFNEMWGSSTMVPNPALARFGNQKTNNTPHQFIIGGKKMELYFSPSDGTNQAIVNALASSQYNIEFGILVFTENTLGNIVKARHDAGVDVKGIIDYVEYTGSEFDMLVANNINVLDYQNADGSVWPDGATFHHKYAIIDRDQPGSDPILVVGTHNWSASAETRNDENTLIIHDAGLANLYHQEFNKRYFELLTPVAFDDNATGAAGETLTVHIIANDFIHFQLSSTTIDIFHQPVHGTVEITGNDLQYTPDPNFTGQDSIGYRLCNGSMPSLCSEAWVRVKILPGYTLVANDDYVFIEYWIVKESVHIDLFKNDSIPVGLDYGFEIIAQPEFGTAAYNIADTLLDYNLNQMPSMHFFDSLVYRIWLTDFPDIADTATLLIENMIFIDNIAENKAFAPIIHPNPAHDHLFISGLLPGMVNMTLYDISGKMVTEKYIDTGSSGKAVVELKVEPGLYGMVLRQGNISRMIKLVIR